MSTTYVNNFSSSPPPTLSHDELYPSPYDVNFAYPILEDVLQTPRLKLVPFLPAVHGEAYWEQVKDRLDLFKYYGSVNHSLESFLTWLELTQRRHPYHCSFAVVDRTRPDPARPALGGSLAGHLALTNAIPGDLVTEIAYVVVFPAFQHTHVAKEMVGLLLRYALQLPGAAPPGCGLRRVEWRAHPDNGPSIGTAKRMGFRWEGEFKYARVLPEELAYVGDRGRPGDPADGRPARRTTILSVCWDDWEEGGVKELVDAVLNK
ncbi:acyl-CoA N-acyltransferase [Epithele typhae]|uniref:acyl-CoA N-acyltransferase n=1 Tax=Epithele typhae TaxID=378194 RepID=UPI002007A35A|nr:acyl-CoA N-acyltransferase [Epithele typhae]KAH9940016.1 acyl-CoA N-acyltransferase [Epithele typhae]